MIRAVIYARVSTARQASDEKVSISEQIADCEALCEAKNYTVVAVYVDDKKYKSGSRMVEPSGTRSDRPEFKRMLKAAADGEYDRIIAWREDRLARGIYAAVPLGRVLEDTTVKIETVHGTFDSSMFFIKSAIGKLEIDAIKERMAMGVSAKLKSGKVWDAHRRYGYDLDEEGHLVLDGVRAEWVRQIYDWYAAGTPVREIRRRLISAGAPTNDRKSGPRQAMSGWSLSTLQHILTAPEYFQGYMTARRGGKEFQIPCPPIITQGLFERVQVLRKENQSHASGLVKGDYLLQGLVYCTCPRKWGVRSLRFRGGGALRKTPLGKYVCPGKSSLPDTYTNPDCPGTIGSRKLDEFVWDSLVELLSDPDQVLRAIDEEIRTRGAEPEVLEYQRDLGRIERELAQLPEQRDWVISMARKRAITEEQMETQLRELDELELALHKEREEKRAPVSRLDRLKALAGEIGEFLKQIDPETDLLTSAEIARLDQEVRTAVFKDRRELALQFVERVVMHKDSPPEIIFKFNLVSGESNESRSIGFALYPFRVLTE